jgi:hypothetical protein
MAEALLAVDERGGEIVARHHRLCPGVHEAGARPLDVAGQHADAVGVHPAQVGAHHEVGGEARVGGGHLERLENRDDEGGQRLGGHGDRKFGHGSILREVR